MKLVLTPNSVAFMDRVLNSPGAFNQFGTMQVRSFTTEDLNVSKNLVRIKGWFKKHVLAKDPKWTEEEPVYCLPKKDITVGLGQSYADVLKTVVEHYKSAGQTAEWCEGYVPLICQLKGETFTDEDPWVDPDAPEPKPEEKKPEPKKD